MRSRIAVFCLMVALAAPGSWAAEKADGLVGLWYSDNNESKIDVYKAKSKDGNMRYYGKIIWLEEPLYDSEDEEAGKAKHDRENPDGKLQDRLIVGLSVLKGFVYNKEDGVWDSGTIYDPEVGKVYKCVITPVNAEGADVPAKIDVRGYVGAPILGRTTRWTRVPPEEESDDEDSDS